MEDIVNDSRFSHITKDPRFKRIPKWEKKIKIDKRFQSMFKDKQFKLNYAVDKRGRPVIRSSSEDLKKYYALSSSSSDDDDDNDNDNDSNDNDAKVSISSEEKLDKKKENSSEHRISLKKSKLNKDQIDSSETESFSEPYKREEKGLTECVKEKLRDLTVDYARGGGVLFSDSSSEEEGSDIDSEEEELDHGWGELDRDAERTDEITNTLALCHMDWDRIRAVDLMVLFNSFLPQGGFLQSVTIYPSEFGLKRMKEEEVKGPLELVDKNNDEEDENDEENKNENEEGSAYSMEKLRQYQLNRLKYFYAILIFDSPETANKVYMECDGMEYESSATRLDLRFVPDNTTFDQEPREICNKLPDPSKYQPRYFTTTALQQAKVDLTWDETNPEREELNKKLMSGQVDGISEADLRDYLATSSEDESGGESGKEESENKHEATADDPVLKYRSLLQEIEESEEKRKKNDVEMEITWGVGLKEKTEKLVQKKLKEKQNDLTPFEKFLEKKKEKKIQKKEEKKKKAKQETGESDNMFSEDDIPSDVDMNDPYFKEEFQGNFNKKEKKIKQKKDADNSREELQQDQAELELLLMNDAEEKNHFSLKSILEQESEDKKKHRKKKKRKQTSTEEKTEDFKVNVKDERFSALYSSHHFNIDPTDPHYRKTKGMEALRAEKISYRQQNQTNLVHTKRRKTVSQHNQDPELSVLVKTVKRKAQNLQGTGR